MEQTRAIPLVLDNWRTGWNGRSLSALLALTAAIGLLGALGGDSFKTLAIKAAGAAIATAVLLSPIRTSIYFYFAYLLFDGALKINSNYNPVVHVAQDLLIIVLMARSCYEGGAEGGFDKFFKTPHAGMCMVLIGWIVFQYVNPFGLGLLPSIAGTKIYVSMLCLYFLIYHHVSRSDIPVLLRWLFVLGMLEGAIAVCEYLYGQEFLMGLHPRYRDMILRNFSGVFYRPFGTTAIPGAPAIWVMLVAPIAGYRLLKSKESKALTFLFLFVAVPTLIFCQVRTAMIGSVVGFLLTFLYPTGKTALRLILGVGSIAIGAACFSAYVDFSANTAHSSQYSGAEALSAAQRNILLERAMTLGNLNTYKTARSGSWNGLIQLSQKTWLGIGLSRVGASSEPWVGRIQSDPYFGVEWSFADNLFRAIFTELGIFGLLAWVLCIGGMIMTLFKNSFGPPSRDRALIWMCACFATIVVISGFGTEGIIYNPISGFFWAYLAIGTKEACGA